MDPSELTINLATIKARHEAVPLGLYRGSVTQKGTSCVTQIREDKSTVIATINPSLGAEMSGDFAKFMAHAHRDMEYLLDRLEELGYAE